MWESRRDFQRVWEGWEAGFMAFHAFLTLSFPRPVFVATDSSAGVRLKRIDICHASPERSAPQRCHIFERAVT